MWGIFNFSHFIFFISAIFFFPNISGIPVVVFHGINDNCLGWMGKLSDQFGKRLNSYSKCIETGAGVSSYLTSIKSQAVKACEEINQDQNFDGDFIVVAVSQGNLIGRHILQACQMKGKVTKYVSIGGPHMGIGKVPNCPADSKYYCKVIQSLAKNIVYFKLLQNYVAPAGYFKDNYHYDNYLIYSSLLADLNNERKLKNENYKKRFSNLDKLILIKFTKDEMIYPNDSEWFQYYKNNSEEVERLEESEFYKNDFIGLRSLNEENKVVFAQINALHIKFSWSDMERMVIPIFT
jgi:palmitoyl-protein thioesterase